MVFWIEADEYIVDMNIINKISGLDCVSKVTIMHGVIKVYLR